MHTNVVSKTISTEGVGVGVPLEGAGDKVHVAAVSVPKEEHELVPETVYPCLLYTSPSPRDRQKSRMPSSA